MSAQRHRWCVHARLKGWTSTMAVDWSRARRRLSLAVFPLVLMSAALTAALHAQQWPTWRGPSASGVSGERGLPVEWSDTRAVAWKSPVRGLGHLVAHRLGRSRRRDVAGGHRRGRVRARGSCRAAIRSRPASARSRRSARGDGQRDVSRHRVRSRHRTAGVGIRDAGGRRAAVRAREAQPRVAESGRRTASASMRGSAPGRSPRSTWPASSSGRRISARSTGRSRSTGATAARRSSTQDTLVLLCYHERASYLLALDARTGARALEGGRPRRRDVLQHAARRGSRPAGRKSSSTRASA